MEELCSCREWYSDFSVASLQSSHYYDWATY